MNKYMLSFQHAHAVRYYEFSKPSEVMAEIFAGFLRAHYDNIPHGRGRAVIQNTPVHIDGNFIMRAEGSLRYTTLYKWVKDDRACDAWGRFTGGRWDSLTPEENAVK